MCFISRIANVASTRKSVHIALGTDYRHIRAKLGPSKAIVSTAHKIARFVNYMLKEKTPDQARGAAVYDA